MTSPNAPSLLCFFLTFHSQFQPEVDGFPTAVNQFTHLKFSECTFWTVRDSMSWVRRRVINEYTVSSSDELFAEDNWCHVLVGMSLKE